MRHILNQHRLWQEVLQKILAYGCIVNICKCLEITKEKYIKFFNEVKAKEFKNIVFVSENAKIYLTKLFRMIQI